MTDGALNRNVEYVRNRYDSETAEKFRLALEECIHSGEIKKFGSEADAHLAILAYVLVDMQPKASTATPPMRMDSIPFKMTFDPTTRQLP